MNTGKNINGKANDLKETVDEILRNERPTLAFVQEPHYKTGASIKVPRSEKYMFWGNDHSGFIVDICNIDCERLDMKTSVRRTYALSISQGSETNFFDLTRLCLCKIKSKYPPEFELLCACWHGPQYKFTDVKKKSHLCSVLRFLLMLKEECGDMALLLGGDFNLDTGKVKEVCRDFAKLMSTTSKPKSKMLWIFSTDFDQMFKEIESDESPYSALDHDVLVMELQIATALEALKRSVKVVDYNESPLEKESDYFNCHMNVRKMSKFEHSPGFHTLSASWHGADAEYSDEAKRQSLISAVSLLLLQIDNRFSPKPDCIELKWDRERVLKDSSSKENIHSSYNTLDTWIFSTSPDQLLRNNENLKEINLDLSDNISNLAKMSTRLIRQGYKHTTNATPVDIHLDIVNMIVKWSQYSKRYLVSGYLKQCTYLSTSVPE